MVRIEQLDELLRSGGRLLIPGHLLSVVSNPRGLPDFYAVRPINSTIGLPSLTRCVGRPLKSLMVTFEESMPR
ncbi:hypothetical protein BH11VER1_BH11VER1_41090 [soil metagenome]